MALLDSINKENDIKNISLDKLPDLADEIREFLLEHVSETGGHLASNLGTVELTIALHRLLNLPKDKIIWDVGHQAYTHKILTGRKNEFDNLRKLGGMSGFPKRNESDCDSFDTGHSSTSISAGLGYAVARDIKGEDYTVVSVIGDGALTGGMAFEALNNAAEFKKNFIIILNDNKMSISENVGGLSSHLASLRTAEAYQEFKSSVHSSLDKLPYGEKVARRMHKTKSSLKQLLIPGMLFENLGITYLGPVDGHNIHDIMQILMEAKKVNGPVLVHVQTVKGRGYIPAMQHPDRFHGIGPFDLETGEPLKKKESPDYTDVFGKTICDIAKDNKKVVAMTAAMADGTGLKRFKSLYKDRFFDVGIAEGHAVTFAAGLACAGLHPVFAVYSSFLQRGFDQIMVDVALQNLPVTFAIDRGGLVGADGETHQGIFDYSYMSMMPNMTVMAPKNRWELSAMLRFATALEAPSSVRYPRGTAYEGLKEFNAPIELGKAEWIHDEDTVAIFAVGNMVETAVKVHDALAADGIKSSVINGRFIKPIDRDALYKAMCSHKLIVTLEENVLQGGYGEKISDEAELIESRIECNNPKIINIGINDRFVEHGSVPQLHKMLGLDPESIIERIKGLI